MLVAQAFQWISFTTWFIWDNYKNRKLLETSLWANLICGFVAFGWGGFAGIFHLYWAYVASLFASYYDEEYVPYPVLQVT